MSNPFNALNPSKNINMDYLRNIYALLTRSNNPMQVFSQLAQGNPQLQQIMQMLQRGGNPQQLFRNMCAQRGINPEEFIRNLTGR